MTERLAVLKRKIISVNYLTQEGKTLPDISLLAPIARLLGTTPDTLLLFHETLTEEEVALFVKELNARLKRDTFEECFEWGKEMIQQHPNCEVLICQIAIVLFSKVLMECTESLTAFRNARLYALVLCQEKVQIKRELFS